MIFFEKYFGNIKQVLCVIEEQNKHDLDLEIFDFF